MTISQSVFEELTELFYYDFSNMRITNYKNDLNPFESNSTSLLSNVSVISIDGRSLPNFDDCNKWTGEVNLNCTFNSNNIYVYGLSNTISMSFSYDESLFDSTNNELICVFYNDTTSLWSSDDLFCCESLTRMMMFTNCE